MADLTLWKNEQLRQLKDDMNRMVKDFWCDFGIPVIDEVQGEMVVTDIQDLDDRLIISADLPGIAPEDLDVTVSPDVLIVSGNRVESLQGADGSRFKRKSKFSNRLKLPCRIDPDKVEAISKNCQLKIILPKCRSAALKKVIIRQS
jgi:HSP20 family protein